MGSKRAVPGMLAVLFLAACENAALGPAAERLTTAEARALASEFEAMGAQVVDGQMASFAGSFDAAPASTEGGAAATVQETRIEFTITRGCPAGGSVVFAGETLRQADRTTRTLTAQTTATKTHRDCARELNGVTLTTSGDPNIALTASRKLVEGKASGLQTLAQKGAFTWTASDGRSGRCEVDFTATFDPATGTHRIAGSICGRQVEITRTRQG